MTYETFYKVFPCVKISKEASPKYFYIAQY